MPSEFRADSIDSTVQHCLGLLHNLDILRIVMQPNSARFSSALWWSNHGPGRGDVRLCYRRWRGRRGLGTGWERYVRWGGLPTLPHRQAFAAYQADARKGPSNHFAECSIQFSYWISSPANPIPSWLIESFASSRIRHSGSVSFSIAANKGTCYDYVGHSFTTYRSSRSSPMYGIQRTQRVRSRESHLWATSAATTATETTIHPATGRERLKRTSRRSQPSRREENQLESLFWHQFARILTGRMVNEANIENSRCERKLDSTLRPRSGNSC